MVYTLSSTQFTLHHHRCSGEIGVQQGDPLGPLLFCLCIHHMGSQRQSELSFFYGTLGGSVEDLSHDWSVWVPQLG